MSKLFKLRIDKWLWAARFYKTRQLAVKAIKNGKIALNGQAVKPSSELEIGDLVCIKKGVYQISIIVDDLQDQRGSATLAQGLCHETKESIAERETLKQQRASQPKIETDRRKPDKRSIRSSRCLKRGES